MNAYESYLQDLKKDRFIRILYHIFRAQDWRILSKENRYYAYERLGREPTLDELADQWLHHGGNQKFWEIHRKAAGYLRTRIDSGTFSQFQVFFMLANEPLKDGAKRDLGHEPEPDELELAYLKHLAGRMREQMSPVVNV